MLALTLKRTTEIKLTVTEPTTIILRTPEQRVRVAIDAPQSVKIVRQEKTYEDPLSVSDVVSGRNSDGM